MFARFWITTLTCAAIVGSSGCGSCRWSQRHGWLPSACVSPRCKNPACLVCSPVPPLYDGWSYAGETYSGGGEVICGDGTCMPGGECGPCGQGMVMEGGMSYQGHPSGECSHCNSQGLESMPMQSMPMESFPEGSFEGMSDRERNATIFQLSPENGSMPMEPAPTPALSPTPIDAAPSTIPQAPPASSIPPASSAPPAAAPMDPMMPMGAPEPPLATPSAALQPSDFFGPRSQRMTIVPAPVREPVQLAAPPQWETRIEIEPVSSLKAPPRQEH